MSDCDEESEPGSMTHSDEDMEAGMSPWFTDSDGELAPGDASYLDSQVCRPPPFRKMHATYRFLARGLRTGVRTAAFSERIQPHWSEQDEETWRQQFTLQSYLSICPLNSTVNTKGMSRCRQRSHGSHSTIGPC